MKIPSGNTILNENTSLLENQRATWKKDRVLSEISAPEPRKDRVLTKQHRRLRGHKCYFDPYTRKFHCLLPPTPALPFSSGDHLPGPADKRGCWTASAFRGQVSYDLRCSMAMLAVDIHTSYVNKPPPLLTFSTMFLSTRKYVASRVCRLHLRWHYIYIYIK